MVSSIPWRVDRCGLLFVISGLRALITLKKWGGTTAAWHSFSSDGHGKDRPGESLFRKGRRLRAPGAPCHRRNTSHDLLGTRAALAGHGGASRAAASQDFSARVRLGR